MERIAMVMASAISAELSAVNNSQVCAEPYC